MIVAVAKWVGNKVAVTLRSAVPTPLSGKLIEINDLGILLELAHGQTFVPMTSVLHISLTK